MKRLATLLLVAVLVAALGSLAMAGEKQSDTRKLDPKKLFRENRRTGYLSISVSCGMPTVQVSHTALLQVTPMQYWAWQRSLPNQKLVIASVIHDGVEFHAIMTDKEREKIAGSVTI